MDDNLNPEKSTKEVLSDYGKEVIGYENGLWRTIVDLTKQPNIVLKGYLEKDQRYVSPFRILISLLTLWGLVNGFILDWYSVFEIHLNNTVEWAQKFETGPKNNQPGTNLKIWAKYLGDFYTKYFIPFLLTYLPALAFLVSRKGKQFGADFKTMLAALAYSYSRYVFVLFMISLLAYFNFMWLIVILSIPLFILQLLGKGDLLTFSVRKFFGTNGKKIDLEMLKWNNILVLVLSSFFVLWVYLTSK